MVEMKLLIMKHYIRDFGYDFVSCNPTIIGPPFISACLKTARLCLQCIGSASRHMKSFMMWVRDQYNSSVVRFGPIEETRNTVFTHMMEPWESSGYLIKYCRYNYNREHYFSPNPTLNPQR